MVSCKGTHFLKDIVLTGSACPGQIVRFTDTLSAKRSVEGSERPHSSAQATRESRRLRTSATSSIRL